MKISLSTFKIFYQFDFDFNTIIYLLLLRKKVSEPVFAKAL